MTGKVEGFNLESLWTNVLQHPNVKGQAKNVKFANIGIEAMKQNPQAKVETVMGEVVQQLQTQKEKSPTLSEFANRLVDMAEFQRKIPFKQRLALRNACAGLRGEKSGPFSSLGNALYELGISIKRWFPSKVSKQYNKRFEEGLRTLLQSTDAPNKLSGVSGIPTYLSAFIQKIPETVPKTMLEWLFPDIPARFAVSERLKTGHQ